jgi:hypothetical protein
MRATAFTAALGYGRVESSSGEHSEIALIVTVKASSDYYRLQWAERTPTAGKNGIDEAKWRARLRQLQPIRICPLQPGEQAPYSSCASSNKRLRG